MVNSTAKKTSTGRQMIKKSTNFVCLDRKLSNPNLPIVKDKKQKDNPTNA